MMKEQHTKAQSDNRINFLYFHKSNLKSFNEEMFIKEQFKGM